MPAVVRRARADSITFHNLIFTNKSVLDGQKKFDDILGCSSADWEGFNFNPEIEPKELYKNMEWTRRGKHDFNIDFYPNFSEAALERYYKEPCFIPSEYPARCLSPWIAAYIFPDGEVRPCLNCTYSYGNIKSGHFSDIWNSPKAVNCLLYTSDAADE